MQRMSRGSPPAVSGAVVAAPDRYFSNGRQISEPPVATGRKACARDCLVDSIRSHINDRLDCQRLSPATIQAAFQVSRATLYRMFGAEGGLARYIRRCRLQEASVILVRIPERPIIEIAYAAGFRSASDFSRAFRRAHGMTPRDFRRQGELRKPA